MDGSDEMRKNCIIIVFSTFKAPYHVGIDHQ